MKNSRVRKLKIKESGINKLKIREPGLGESTTKKFKIKSWRITKISKILNSRNNKEMNWNKWETESLKLPRIRIEEAKLGKLKLKILLTEKNRSKISLEITSDWSGNSADHFSIVWNKSR